MIGRISLAMVLAGAAGAAGAQAWGDAPLGVLLAVGDIARCGGSPPRQQDEAVAALAAREVGRAEATGLPVRLVLLGDLAYPAGTPEQYADCFDPAWGDLRDLMLPVPGNHDYKGRSEARGFFGYFHDAPLDAEGRPLVTPEAEGNYALRFPDPDEGPWLLVGLNTGREGRPSDLGALREALGPEGPRCVLAFAHHFRFSSGLHGHGGDEEHPDAALEPGAGMEEAFELLDRVGASVLLSGHDHHFEQLGPQDAGGEADPEGLRSFVVGTGGGDLYLEEMPFRYERQAASQEALDGEHPGLLRIELFADRYAWSFLRTDGTELLPEPHEAECQQR